MALIPSFSLGFSSKKSSGTQTGTIKDDLDRFLKGMESQTGTKSSEGSTTTSGTQSSVGNATGQTTQEQTGTQSTQQQEQVAGSQFGAGMLDSLKALFAGSGESFGAGMDGQAKSLNASLAGLNFSAADYAKAATDAARVDIGDSLDSSLNGLMGATGGSAGGNTMVALLSNKLRTAAEAKIAGIGNEALAQGNAIVNNNVASASGAANASMAPLMTLAGLIKGGETTQTGTTAGTAATSQSSAGTTAQQTDEKTSTMQTQLTQLLDLVSQLTNTDQSETSNTTRTLDLKNTGKETGFSMSAGLGGK